MAPAADMFEMGVKVQVLKRGTMFAMRAAKLYEVYKEYPSMEAIPAPVRAQLEKDMFKAPLETIWAQTREFFLKRDPREAAKGDADLKHRMALVFRWYLGLASRWANAGDPARRMDYQVWCGPAMGAFNEWARGTFLQDPKERTAALVGMNILIGAAYLTRLNILRVQGAPLGADLARFAPLPDGPLHELLGPERLLA
jgi:PfaD family protein